MMFLTIDNEIIDLNEADRVHVGRRVIEAQRCWVIFVNIGDRRHTLVSTGEDRRQASFHCKAINQCRVNS